MAEKLFILAGLSILSAQVQCNALPENNSNIPDYGLIEVKKLALTAIKRYYDQATAHGQSYLPKITEYTQNIENNKEMSKIVEEQCENHANRLTDAAKELFEKGQSKPLRYFLCVEFNRYAGEKDVRKEERNYKIAMEEAEERAMNKALRTQIAIENMNGVFGVLLEDFNSEIKACRDIQCVESGVGRAWKSYSLSRRIMTSFMVSFMEEYQIFIRESCDNADKAYGLMEAAALRRLNAMNKC